MNIFVNNIMLINNKYKMLNKLLIFTIIKYYSLDLYDLLYFLEMFYKLCTYYLAFALMIIPH